MIKKKYVNCLILFIVSLISIYYWYEVGKSYKYVPAESIYEIEAKPISSIQYQEIKESYGASGLRTVTNSIITYKGPDLLKIENSSNIKTIEIYNKNKYIYFEEGKNRINIKECFPIDNPYITEIEKKMQQIIQNEDCEFFGYEEINDIRLKVLGTKYKSDGSNYMNKIWVGEVNHISLPFKEEYFIDNVVVSKSTYTYMSVNGQINDNIFTIGSLPKLEVVNDGVVPKYFDNYNDAQKLADFKLKLPDKLPEGFIPSEIAVIPPVSNPKFYCIYYNSGGDRIYLNESKDRTVFNPNALLDNMECEVKTKGENTIITWKQDNVYISISSNTSEYDNSVFLAENISNGRLVKR